MTGSPVNPLRNASASSAIGYSVEKDGKVIYQPGGEAAAGVGAIRPWSPKPFSKTAIPRPSHPDRARLALNLAGHSNIGKQLHRAESA